MKTANGSCPQINYFQVPQHIKENLTLAFRFWLALILPTLSPVSPEWGHRRALKREKNSLTINFCKCCGLCSVLYVQINLSDRLFLFCLLVHGGGKKGWLCYCFFLSHMLSYLHNLSIWNPNASFWYVLSAKYIQLDGEPLDVEETSRFCALLVWASFYRFESLSDETNCSKIRVFPD